jgi:hypothetical protein
MAEHDRHMNDEEIEGYSAGTLPEDALAHAERHLLVCDGCRQRVAEADAFVPAMRRAAARVRERKARFRLLPRLIPVFAGMILLLLSTAIWLGPAVLRRPPVVAIALNTSRGPGLMTRAPAGARLNLAPVLTGLPVQSSYRVEVVDRGGEYLWQGRYPGAVAGPLRPGVYFVRIYATGGELLREYGLQVEQR